MKELKANLLAIPLWNLKGLNSDFYCVLNNYIKGSV